MENKLKLMLFKIIYDKLNLVEYERKFEEINVPTKNIVNPTGEQLTSKYFFLNNEVQLDKLTEEEKKSIENCLNNPNEENMNKLNSFLTNNIYRLLLPETSAKYLYWPDREHDAPADHIVIAFHTLDFKKGETDEIRYKRDDIVYPILNKIQDESPEKYGLKVAVIKYNEVPTKVMRFDEEQIKTL